MSGGTAVRTGKWRSARAGAQRLHGSRFPPEGLGLDGQGAAGPSYWKGSSGGPTGPHHHVAGNAGGVMREGSSPQGRYAPRIGASPHDRRGSIEPDRRRRRALYGFPFGLAFLPVFFASRYDLSASESGCALRARIASAVFGTRISAPNCTASACTCSILGRKAFS